MNSNKGELLQLLLDTFQKYCPVRVVSKYAKNYHAHNADTLNEILSRYKGLDTKILFVSTYNRRYTRTESLAREFESLGLRYTPVFFCGIFRYLTLLLYIFRNSKKYDVVFLNFRGHEILPFIKLITRKPIIFDHFVSAYDTLCFDRCIFRPRSILGRFLRWYDTWLCKIADVCLVDTAQHASYFRTTFGAGNIYWLYVGCNESLFKEGNNSNLTDDNLRVFWHGNALPLQGVENILCVISDLRWNDKIRFTIVGPVRRNYAYLFNNQPFPNTTFVDWIPYESLPSHIQMADICLGGPFAISNPKSQRIIAGKTFQYLACSKPTIVADNRVHEEIF